MKIGYSRVSTQEQNFDLQSDALKAAGCESVFPDEGISETVKARSGLDAALSAVGEGDTFIVWKLDRLGRSLGFLTELIDQLGQRGAGFVALQDGIDTNTSGGKLVLHIMGALAEFERDLISEWTTAGMASILDTPKIALSKEAHCLIKNDTFGELLPHLKSHPNGASIWGIQDGKNNDEAIKTRVNFQVKTSIQKCKEKGKAENNR